jgi:hypothetical protein
MLPVPPAASATTKTPPRGPAQPLTTRTGARSMACTSGSTVRPHEPLRPPPPRRHRLCRCCCRCRREAFEALYDVEPWAAAPRHKYQSQTHDCRTVMDPRQTHTQARRNPSSAGKHGREQVQHATHMPPGIQCPPSRASRAEEKGAPAALHISPTLTSCASSHYFATAT